MLNSISSVGHKCAMAVVNQTKSTWTSKGVYFNSGNSDAVLPETVKNNEALLFAGKKKRQVHTLREHRGCWHTKCLMTKLWLSTGTYPSTLYYTKMCGAFASTQVKSRQTTIFGKNSTGLEATRQSVEMVAGTTWTLVRDTWPEVPWQPQALLHLKFVYFARMNHTLKVLRENMVSMPDIYINQLTIMQYIGLDIVFVWLTFCKSYRNKKGFSALSTLQRIIPRMSNPKMSNVWKVISECWLK